MKISKIIRETYFESFPRYQILEKMVKETLEYKVKDKGWNFISRVKDLESFAQKIETCRFDEPSELEDFFACTIVVPTAEDFREAELIVNTEFKVYDRRPKVNSKTDKSAFDFCFDDLRLYVYKPSPENLPPTKLDMVKFEIQIKTIFQQAWSDATHDYVYKSGSASWARERVAYQIRAILEQADVMLMLSKSSGINNLPTLAKRNNEMVAIDRLINQINTIWEEEQLPKDKKTLAKTIYGLLNRVGCADRFRDIINEEVARIGGDVPPVNLSPYSFVVQALLYSSVADYKKYFREKRYFRNKGNKNIICIHSDMDIPDWVWDLKSGVQNLES